MNFSFLLASFAGVREERAKLFPPYDVRPASLYRHSYRHHLLRFAVFLWRKKFYF